MALTPILCKKFEKKTIFNVMNIVSGIAFAFIFVLYLIFPTTLGGVPIILLSIAFLIASAGVGFIMVLQSMMIADCVDYEEHTNGTRPDGVFFSGQSFLTKLAAGLAVMIQGICYAIVGYEGDAVTSMNAALSSGLVTFAEEYRTFAMIMFFLVSIPPAIGMILSIIPMLKYELNDKEHSRILDELNAKRLANANGEVMTLEDVATEENVDAATSENAESATEEQTVDTMVMPVVAEDAAQEAEQTTEETAEKVKAVEEKAEEVAEENVEEVQEQVEVAKEPVTEEAPAETEEK